MDSSIRQATDATGADVSRDLTAGDRVLMLALAVLPFAAATAWHLLA